MTSLSDRLVFVRDGAHSKFSNTKVMEGLHPISGLIPFFLQGQPPPDNSIGEMFVRIDDALSQELPQGMRYDIDNPVYDTEWQCIDNPFRCYLVRS